MPLSSSTSSSSLVSNGSEVSKRGVASSSSSPSEQTIFFSKRTPTAAPMSRTESPEGSFERILDEQEKRMRLAIGKQANLSEKNKKAWANYQQLADGVFPSDNTEAEALLKRLDIKLIDEFDSKTTIEAILDDNIRSAKQVNDPKNSSYGSIATNSIPPDRLNKIKNYLRGRIKAAATILLKDNPSRLTPEQFVEKINQASIESRFLQLVLLLTEKDPNKKPTEEVREKAIYEIILLATAIKTYSNAFTIWYSKNKQKFQEVIQEIKTKTKTNTNANTEKNTPSERVSALEGEVRRLQKELNQARDAFRKEQERAQELEKRGKQQQIVTVSAKDQQAIDELQKKVEAFQNELLLIKSDLAIASKTIEQKEETIQGLQAQIAKLKADSHDQEQKVLEESNKASKAIESHNAFTLKSIEKEKKLTDQIAQLMGEIAILKKDNDGIQQELQKIRSELTIVNSDSDVKQTTINSLNERLQASENIIAEKANLVKKLTADLATSKYENITLRGTFDKKAVASAEKISALEEEKIKLEQSLSALKKDNDGIQQELQKIRSELTMASSDSGVKQTTINSLNEKLQASENIIAEKANLVKKLTADLATSKYENITLRGTFDKKAVASAEKISALEEEKIKLEQSLSALKKDNDGIQQELQRMRSELTMANSDSGLKQTTINSLNEKLQASENIIAEKANLVKKLTADLATSKRENITLRETFEQKAVESAEKISALEEEKRKLGQSLSAEKKSLEQATVKISLLEKEVEDINSELASKKDQIRDLKRKVILLENKVQDFECEKAKYREERSKLETEISRLKAKLKTNKLKDMQIIKEKDEVINKLKQELDVLNRKVSEFEMKERDFLRKEEQRCQLISSLNSELKSSVENTATVEKELKQELSLLTVKVSEFETKEKAYRVEQDSLQLRISELQEAYDYLVLTNLFAKAFTLPSNAIKAAKALHEFIEKYSVQSAHILLEKIFSEIGRLMEGFPSAGPEFAKIAIYMLYDLVENSKMQPRPALRLLLSISPAMRDFLDRAPISQYLNILVFLIKCGDTEQQQRNQALVIETLDKRKEDCDLYKVLKQMLKQGHKEHLEVSDELRESLIQFQSTGLVPKGRELFKLIKSLEKDFQVNSKRKVFPGEFSIKDQYIEVVVQLENDFHTSKKSTIQRNGTFSRIGRRGSIRIKDKNFATISFWQSPEEKASDRTLTLPEGLRRKSCTSHARPALTTNSFTPPTEQELDSSNSNGVRTGFTKK